MHYRNGRDDDAWIDDSDQEKLRDYLLAHYPEVMRHD